MLKLSLKWGAIAGGVMTALLLASFIAYPDMDTEHMAAAETYGYAAIFASLAVIFLALREQARTAGAEPPSVWRKIMLGVAVSAVAGVVFGVYNLVYTTWLNPGFMDAYYAHYVAQLPVQSGPEYDRMVAALEADKAMFMNPFTQFFVMASTVLAAGIPTSVLLAVLHSVTGGTAAPQKS
jgi:hypothetical protein